MCNSMLGWRYEGAEEESQRYKVGKYILETKCVVGWSSWELEDFFVDGGGGEEGGERGRGDEGVEFDSQDEEECEDLFAGVWTARGAKRRRERRRFRAGGGGGEAG